MQKEKRLTPGLRFADFGETWKEKKLGEIIIKVGSGSTPKGGIKVYTSLGVPFIRSQNVFGNQLQLDEIHIPKSIHLKMKGSTVLPKDILLNITGGSIGRSCVVPEEFIEGNVNQHVCIIRLKSNNPEFLQSFLSSDRGQKLVYQSMTGSGREGLNFQSIRGFKIVIPKQEEQQKIANFLTSIDNQIQNLEKKKSLLEQYKKGVMQKIFKQELRFKDEDGSDYPKWVKKKLGDLTYKVGKKNKENIQYPIYSINNQEGFRPQSEQFEGLDSNDRGYDISLYKIVHKETFAYNPARINVGSIGYSYDLNEVIVSSLYVCFKTNKELEDLYLLAYLDTDRFNKDILRFEEGGVRQYLFYDNFSQIKIPLPSNEEQIKIANFLSVIDKNIALVNTKIERTKSYKKGLLQQMFV
jgi:type I restriction enzyme S subunit